MTTLRTLTVGLAAGVLIGAAAAPTTAGEALEIGKPAPDFTLTDTNGKEHTLSDYTGDGKVVVLEWFNPDCPFVKKHHQKNKTMSETRSAFAEKEVVWLAINSGAPGKQGHGLEHNVKAMETYGIEYPLLLDEDGKVGRAYHAKTTPHMYVISPEGNLLYQGAIDDNASAGKLGETNYVESCLSAVFAGEEVEVAQSKPYGCSVKYGKTAAAVQ